jgi:hypothetical protein
VNLAPRFIAIIKIVNAIPSEIKVAVFASYPICKK